MMNPSLSIERCDGWMAATTMNNHNFYHAEPARPGQRTITDDA